MVTFTKDSQIVKSWVRLISNSNKTLDDVPNMGNLREVVTEIINSGMKV